MSKVVCENFKIGNCRLGWRCPDSHRWDPPKTDKIIKPEPVNKRSYYNTKTLEKIGGIIDETLWHKFLIDLDMKISSYHALSDIILISSPYHNRSRIVSAVNDALSAYNLTYISPLIIDYMFMNDKELTEKLKFVASTDINNMDEIKALIPKMSIIIIDIVSSEMVTFPLYLFNLVPKYGNINKHDGNNSFMNASSFLNWRLRWSIDERITSKNFINIMDDICKEIMNNIEMKKYFNVEACTDEMSVHMLEMDDCMALFGPILDDDELDRELAELEELEADELLFGDWARNTQSTIVTQAPSDSELAELEVILRCP